MVPRLDGVPDSPTSPGAPRPSLRHTAVTSSWAAEDDNNNRAAGGNAIRSGGSRRIAGDDPASFRSRVVVHVQIDEP